MKVSLRGFKEFERALAEELPKATARNTLTRAGTNALEPMRQRMAELAPYDPLDRDEDGQHLNQSMRTQPAKAKLARKMGTARNEGLVLLTGPAPVGKRARSNAGWQERGTAKMAAHAYVRPAADAEGERTIERLGKELGEQIEKAKTRMARKAARGK